MSDPEAVEAVRAIWESVQVVSRTPALAVKVLLLMRGLLTKLPGVSWGEVRRAIGPLPIGGLADEAEDRDRAAEAFEVMWFLLDEVGALEVPGGPAVLVATLRHIRCLLCGLPPPSDAPPPSQTSSRAATPLETLRKGASTSTSTASASGAASRASTPVDGFDAIQGKQVKTNLELLFKTNPWLLLGDTETVPDATPKVSAFLPVYITESLEACLKELDGYSVWGLEGFEFTPDAMARGRELLLNHEAAMAAARARLLHHHEAAVMAEAARRRSGQRPPSNARGRTPPNLDDLSDAFARPRGGSVATSSRGGVRGTGARPPLTGERSRRVSSSSRHKRSSLASRGSSRGASRQGVHTSGSLLDILPPSIRRADKQSNARRRVRRSVSRGKDAPSWSASLTALLNAEPVGVAADTTGELNKILRPWLATDDATALHSNTLADIVWDKAQGSDWSPPVTPSRKKAFHHGERAARSHAAKALAHAASSLPHIGSSGKGRCEAPHPAAEPRPESQGAPRLPMPALLGVQGRVATPGVPGSHGVLPNGPAAMLGHLRSLSAAQPPPDTLDAGTPLTAMGEAVCDGLGDADSSAAPLVSASINQMFDTAAMAGLAPVGFGSCAEEAKKEEAPLPVSRLKEARRPNAAVTSDYNRLKALQTPGCSKGKQAAKLPLACPLLANGAGTRAQSEPPPLTEPLVDASTPGPQDLLHKIAYLDQCWARGDDASLMGTTRQYHAPAVVAAIVRRSSHSLDAPLRPATHQGYPPRQQQRPAARGTTPLTHQAPLDGAEQRLYRTEQWCDYDDAAANAARAHNAAALKCLSQLHDGRAGTWEKAGSYVEASGVASASAGDASPALKRQCQRYVEDPSDAEAAHSPRSAFEFMKRGTGRGGTFPSPREKPHEAQVTVAGTLRSSMGSPKRREISRHPPVPKRHPSPLASPLLPQDAGRVPDGAPEVDAGPATPQDLPPPPPPPLPLPRSVAEDVRGDSLIDGWDARRPESPVGGPAERAGSPEPTEKTRRKKEKEGRQVLVYDGSPQRDQRRSPPSRSRSPPCHEFGVHPNGGVFDAVMAGYPLLSRQTLALHLPADAYTEEVVHTHGSSAGLPSFAQVKFDQTPAGRAAAASYRVMDPPCITRLPRATHKGSRSPQARTTPAIRPPAMLRQGIGLPYLSAAQIHDQNTYPKSPTASPRDAAFEPPVQA